MFGFDKWPTSKAEKPAASQEVGPKNTSPEALELLERMVREAVAEVPSASGVLTEQDFRMTVNSLALMQEQKGSPYTKEMLEAVGPEFHERVKASLENRLAVKPSTSESVYRVVGPDGFVLGSAGSIKEVGDIADERRAA